MTMECKAFEEQQETWGSGPEGLRSFRGQVAGLFLLDSRRFLKTKRFVVAEVT